jgi:hypothetical protein
MAFSENTRVKSPAILHKDSVIRNFRTPAADGKNYNSQFNNLVIIISVGYWANSDRTMQFRQWATNILRDFAIRGYALDKEQLKNGAFLGGANYE